MIEVGRIWDIGAEEKTQSILYERVLRRKDKKGSISLAAVCYSNSCRQSQYEDLEVHMCCRAFIQCEIFKDVGFLPGEPSKAVPVSVLYPWSCFFGSGFLWIKYPTMCSLLSGFLLWDCQLRHRTLLPCEFLSCFVSNAQ